jgi:SPP1 family phage portal protein
VTQEELIRKLLDNLELQRTHHHKLKNYYDGKHNILFEKGKSDPTKSDMRAYFNYCRKMVQNQVGYILGKPVNYTSKSDNPDFLNLIDYYFSTWEKEHNINLKIQSAIHGYAYEVSFINPKGEFQNTYFTPLQMEVLHDGSVDSKICFAVRKYKLEFSDTEYIEVWDNVNYYRYELSNMKLLEQKPHRFSRCPVRKLKNNDNQKSTFADIIRIIDMYNSLHSISVQEMMDFRNAYLVLSNCDLDQETAQNMKENGILILPNDKAKAEWLTKNPNSQFFKDLLDNLKNEIYIQSNQVNLNESFQSNTSGVAIRLKLQELENQSAIAESIFERVLKDRMEFFCEYLQIAENKTYDYKDIAINFTRNVPVDEAAIVQMVKDLDGIVPLEERLSWLPRVSNPSLTYKKLLDERDTTGLGKDLLGG